MTIGTKHDAIRKLLHGEVEPFSKVVRRVSFFLFRIKMMKVVHRIWIDPTAIVTLVSHVSNDFLLYQRRANTLVLSPAFYGLSDVCHNRI
jgi:hypothetical protein